MRVGAWMVAGALIAALAGCGGGDTENANSTGSSAGSNSPDATQATPQPHSLTAAQVENVRQNLVASARLDFGGGRVEPSSFEACFLGSYADRLTPPVLQRLVNLDLAPGTSNAYPPLTDISAGATRACGQAERDAPALFSAESQLPWASVRSVAVRRCDPEDVRLHLGRGSPTTGGVLVGLQLTNAGQRVCRLADELSYEIVAPDGSPVSIEGNGWAAVPGTLSIPSRIRNLQVNWHWLNWCGVPRKLRAVARYGPMEVSHTTLAPPCHDPGQPSGLGPAGIEQY
jgi:hypothetical protein